MTSKDNTPPKLKKAVHLGERLIIKILIALMTVLLVIATIEMVIIIFKALSQPREDFYLIDLDNLMQIFGMFLLVLIGIELLDTIKVYFKKHVIHVEVVMLVALIAVSRKIIILDYSELDGFMLLGISSIIIALAGGYYLIKKTGGCGFWPKEMDEVEEIIVKENPKNVDKKIYKRKKSIKNRRDDRFLSSGQKHNQEEKNEKTKIERPPKNEERDQGDSQ